MTNSTGAQPELAGRVALITGGSSGIGLATAIRFAREGASVALIARNEERLRQAAEEVGQATDPQRVLAIAADVTREAEVIAAFEKTVERFGQLDIVVNNAGYGKTGMIDETSLADWEEMIAVHATAYFLVARQAVKIFKQQQKGGAIVFVVSDNAVKASKAMLAYSVGKAAELQMARCLAEEAGPYQIRVNSVLPGAVFGGSRFWTPEFRQARAKARGYEASKLELEYPKHTALGVIIMPEEVAEVILFLAGDRSAKMTGNALVIDGGGATAYMR